MKEPKEAADTLPHVEVRDALMHGAVKMEAALLIIEQFRSLSNRHNRRPYDSRFIVMQGHHMTTPEQRLLTAQRRQIVDDQTMDRLELDTPEREDAWVKDFMGRLTGMFRDIGKS